MKLAYFFLVALLCTVSSQAYSQMVNMQEILSGPITKGWTLTGEASQQTETGNSSFDVYTAQGTVSYKQPRYLILFSTKREYSSASGVSTSDSYFDHLHSTYRFTRNFGWEEFAQQSSDRFRRNLRTIAYGTGPRFQFHPVRRLSLAFSINYMREHEFFTDLIIPAFERTDVEADGTAPTEDLILPPEPNRTTDRISNMLYLNWRWGKYSSIGNTTYFEPKFGDANNRKVLNEASFLLGINGLFSFRFTHSLTFNSNPPARVEKTDRSFAQSWYITFNVDDAVPATPDSETKDKDKDKDKDE